MIDLLASGNRRVVTKKPHRVFERMIKRRCNFSISALMEAAAFWVIIRSPERPCLSVVALLATFVDVEDQRGLDLGRRCCREAHRCISIGRVSASFCSLKARPTFV